MTGRNFADGVRLALNQNSQDAPVDVDERTIVWIADKVRNALLPRYIAANGIDSIGSFVTGMYFDVKKDSDRDLKYIDTENKIVSLAGNMGLLSIGWAQDLECDFIISKPAQQGIYSKLEIGQIQKPTAWQEGGRIYLRYVPFGMKQALVRAVPSLSEMDMNEEMPIPSDLVNDVMMQVIAVVQSNGSEDKPNDGNDNQQTIKA
jgi:hypothetical protein